MVIKFFVASSWEDRQKAMTMAYMIEEGYGWENTSEWWQHQDRAKKLQYAMEDLKNLKRSEVLFVWNGEYKTSGKMIEIGIALALGIPVYIFGKELTTVYGKLTIYAGEEF